MTAPGDGGEVFPVAAAIVPAEGAPQPNLGGVSARGVFGACRLIVLAVGTSKGAGNTKATGSDPGQDFPWDLII